MSEIAGSGSGFRRIWRRLGRRRAVRLAGAVVGVFVFGAIFGPGLAQQDPIAQDLAQRLEPPSGEHWLGTDEFGRDIFARLVHGTRISLTVGLVSVGIGALVGGLLGLLTGYFGGWVDLLGMRLTDVMLAFPSILLAVVIVAALGPSLANAMIAVGVVSVPQYARLVRSAVLATRSAPFVEATRGLGASETRIVFGTILPQCAAPLLVQTSLGLATAILDAAGLSFLGLGAQPPTPEWGAMLGNGRDYVIHAPWILAAPGLAILFTVLGFNLLGDGLRDAMDPRFVGALRAPNRTNPLERST